MLVVKWRGRVLRNPVVLGLATVAAALLGMFAILVVAATLPLHFALRATSRRGFVQRPRRGLPRYVLSRIAFRKRARNKHDTGARPFST
jgi:hypothetical protein